MSVDPTEDVKERDEELLRAVLSAPEGDLRAFEQLVQQYQNRILADCRFLTRDENNAEDLAQEVFVKAFFGLRSFERRSSFRHWLQRIKVNHCLNHLKKSEGKSFLAIDDEVAEGLEQLRVSPVAERELEAMGDRQRIADILDSMPAPLRVPLILRDMDELSYEDIAATLGIGLSAVKMRIRRARERFRRCYEEEDRARKGCPPR
jgi:RNA polymerase sigma-70 factor, ECF subfamily